MTEQTPTSEPTTVAAEARTPEETATLAVPPTPATGGTGADPEATAATEVVVPAPASADRAAIAASTAYGPAPVGDPTTPAGEGSWAEALMANNRPTRFMKWYGRRPFWGGLLVFLGGGEILVTEKAPLPVIMHIGMQGLAGYLVPTVMLLCGALLVFNPAQRVFYSVLSVLLALTSWVTSNLGGFFVGLLLGLAGSILAFGWLPDQPPRRSMRRRGARPSTP
jgi:hypothetical protein